MDQKISKLLQVLLFVIIYKTIDIYLFNVGSNYALNEMYSYGSLSNLYSGRVNSEVVAFGSSRTYLHINPKIIEENTNYSAYNMGKDGTNIEQVAFTIKEYLIHNSPPKVIILEADSLQLIEDKLRFEKKYFKKFQGLSFHTDSLFQNTYLKRIAFQISKSHIFSNHGLGVIFNGIKYGFKSNRIYLEPDKDFGDWFFVKGAHLKSVSKNVVIPETNIEFSLSGDRKKEYAEIIGYLNSIPNMQTILLHSPTLTKIGMDNQDSVDNFFNELASHSSKIHYLNLRNDSEMCTDLSFWYNSSHLNIYGANVLTNKIIEYIKVHI